MIRDDVKAQSRAANESSSLFSVGGQVVTQQDVERFVTQTKKKDVDRVRSIAGRNGSSKRANKEFMHALKDIFKS